jgi:phospholipid transport system substrate-binding protein
MKREVIWSSKKMSKVFWLVAVWLVCLVPPVRAVAAAPDAEEVVKQTTTQLFDTLKREGTDIKGNRQRLYALVERIVLPHVDLHRMSEEVLGRFWREANSAQRETFMQEFKGLLERTYSTAVLEYTDQQIRYLPTQAHSGGEVLVRTVVEQPEGTSIPVDYAMRREGEQWKVFDVVIDGASLVVDYRGEFAEEIERYGMDELLKRLADKNQSTS